MGRMIEQADAQCKIHAAFMGGFEPCRYDVWAPDARDLNNKSYEVTATRQNITMLSAMGGMIGIRPDGKGGEESFVAAHFVAGGGWDTGTIAGHLEEGTKVFGVMQVFVTEILDIDVIYPCQLYQDAAAHAVNDDGAEVIVLSAAGQSELTAAMAKELGVPVLDGVDCALILAEGMCRAGFATSKKCRYQ